MTILIDQNIRRFNIPMNQLTRMQIMHSLGYLVNNVPPMFLLQNIFSNQRIQVNIHELKHEINVSLILRLDNFL